jgi:hypothetical protein
VGGAFLPSVGIDVLFLLSVRGNLMVPMQVAGRVDDASVMPTIGQHEGDIGVGQNLNFRIL